MSEHLTRVEIAFCPKHLNHWLRFGEPAERRYLDRSRPLVLFEPCGVFGYIRWHGNEYGTQDWRFAVVRTGDPSRFLSPLEGVFPGGEVLLVARGNARVKRTLSLIDAIEARGFEPSIVSPAYYRHVHNRIAIGRPVRAYSQAQHEAHLAARRVAP